MQPRSTSHESLTLADLHEYAHALPSAHSCFMRTDNVSFLKDDSSLSLLTPGQL